MPVLLEANWLNWAIWNDKCRVIFLFFGNKWKIAQWNNARGIITSLADEFINSSSIMNVARLAKFEAGDKIKNLVFNGFKR